MWFTTSSLPDQLKPYLPQFLEIVGSPRWFKRADQLDSEQRRSPYGWKIVSDAHWLEMAISRQCDVFEKEQRLLPELIDDLTLVSLQFVETIVEVHIRLSPVGQRQLEGKLRDGLKAKSGFAALFLELDLARRLITEGYNVDFPDLERTAQFDLRFTRDGFIGEVECKSVSADAGRKIHRKDFYRFMEGIRPALEQHRQFDRREILKITLNDRLSPNQAYQAELRQAASRMLSADAEPIRVGRDFRIERLPASKHIQPDSLADPRLLYAACRAEFGDNTHIAGSMDETAGCLVVMRSDKADDTSSPILEAMQDAASQFSGDYPSFIAIQFQEIEPADLMLAHLRRRMGILSGALFDHYEATHVNAVHFSGFSAVVARDGRLGTPAFAIVNPKPRLPVTPTSASAFLATISDAEFAQIVGAPPPGAAEV